MNDVPDQLIKPTKERLRHSIGHDDLTEAQPGGVVKKTGARREWDALEHLYRNGCIDYDEYRAGETFYLDWDVSHKGPRVIVDYGERIASFGVPSGLDGVERRVFHSRRFQDANKILEELGTRKPVHWVCINGIKAEHIGRKFFNYRGYKTASSSGVTAIKISLHRLAKFYGIIR